jgi:phage-related baseplate assembly protein
VTVIPGVDSVENRSDWLVSEASDTETDEQLRRRYTLAWQGLSGCTKYAYESWAMAVTGVTSVKIMDQHPRGEGTVDVIVVGTAGIPTQNLLDAVEDKILGTGNNDDLAPLNDDVLIKAPTAVQVDVAATLILLYGDPEAILAEAENRLRSLFNATESTYGFDLLAVGHDATIDRLKYPMMLPGVKEAILTSPAANVSVPADGLAVLNSLNLSFEVATED